MDLPVVRCSWLWRLATKAPALTDARNHSVHSKRPTRLQNGKKPHRPPFISQTVPHQKIFQLRLHSIGGEVRCLVSSTVIAHLGATHGLENESREAE